MTDKERLRLMQMLTEKYTVDELHELTTLLIKDRNRKQKQSVDDFLKSKIVFPFSFKDNQVIDIKYGDLKDMLEEYANQKQTNNPIKINVKKFKIGDECFITENARAVLGLPDDVVYTIKDIILRDKVEFNIVLNAEEFGKDWVQFFREDELIPISKLKIE